MPGDWVLVKTASEISLKSDFVRQSFMKALEWNIKQVLKSKKLGARDFFRKGGRIFFQSPDAEKALKALKKVFGIHALAVARKFDRPELPAIEQEIALFAPKVLKKSQTFAVRAKVIGRHHFNSHAVEVRGGDAVRNAVKGVKVNLSSPQVKITVEAFEECFFLYANQSRGFGGLPVGVSGRIGFFVGKKTADDFKACWLLLKRGCEIVLVGKKAKALAKKLKDWNSGNDFIIAENAEDALLKGVIAFAAGDSKLDEKSLKSFEAFDAKQKLLVLRPLLLNALKVKV